MIHINKTRNLDLNSDICIPMFHLGIIQAFLQHYYAICLISG